MKKMIYPKGRSTKILLIAIFVACFFIQKNASTKDFENFINVNGNFKNQARNYYADIHLTKLSIDGIISNDENCALDKHQMIILKELEVIGDFGIVDDFPDRINESNFYLLNREYKNEAKCFTEKSIMSSKYNGDMSIEFKTEKSEKAINVIIVCTYPNSQLPSWIYSRTISTTRSGCND